MKRLPPPNEQVQDVAARWKNTYCHKDGWRCMAGSINHEAIYMRLIALPPTATASDVEQIIGNNSWCAQHKCSECGTESDVAFEVGEEPDYESATAVLCRECAIRVGQMALLDPNT